MQGGIHELLRDPSTARQYACRMDKSETEFWEEVGRRLKRARDDRGWTLEVAEERTGIKRTTIGNYERAIRRPHASEVSRLGAAYERSPAWLLCLDEESTLQPRQRAILFVFDKAEPSGQDAILLIGASHAGIHTATTAAEVEKIALEHQGTKAVIAQTGEPADAPGPGKQVEDQTGEERAGAKRARRKRS